MARNEIVIDGRDLLSSIRLGVRMPRAFGLRMWIATRLFELAGLISGATVVVEVDDDDAEQADEVQAEVEAIDAEVGRVNESIRQGARPTNHRFRA